MWREVSAARPSIRLSRSNRLDGAKTASTGARKRSLVTMAGDGFPAAQAAPRAHPRRDRKRSLGADPRACLARPRAFGGLAGRAPRPAADRACGPGRPRVPRWTCLALPALLATAGGHAG